MLKNMITPGITPGIAPGIARAIALVLAAATLAACSGNQVLSSFSPSGGTEVATNLIYDRPNGLRLDVYTPDGVQNAPTVVFFYGGRWSQGDKSEYKFVGDALAARGMVVVVPNYREYPQVRYPAFVEDGASAVVWAREHAAQYGGDPAQVYVMGHSSGAHIAAMLALDEEFLKAYGGTRGWLKGMIGLAGPYDFLPLTDPDLREIFGPPEDFEKSQPIFYADGGNPPLLLIHGENDTSVWPKNTVNLADAVTHAGGAVETVIYPKLSHTCAMAALSAASAPLCGRPNVLDEITGFIRRVGAGKVSAPGGNGMQTEALPAPVALPPPEQALPPPEAPSAASPPPPPPPSGFQIEEVPPPVPVPVPTP